ncbi:MAG TPA: type II toxin-antitoxin system Phd/YefM family antitoxin [Chthoniobacterales bacterium]|jgi:prevent-host-death family protein
MREYTTGEARDRFSEVINEAVFGDERVVLTRHGKPIAAVVPLSVLEILQELERIIDLDEAQKALKEGKAEGLTSLDDLKKEFGYK